MTKSNGILPERFYTIISKAMEDKSYGSIEIYLENGKVTQITQRIINKIDTKEKQPSQVDSAARTI